MGECTKYKYRTGYHCWKCDTTFGVWGESFLCSNCGEKFLGGRYDPFARIRYRWVEYPPAVLWKPWTWNLFSSGYWVLDGVGRITESTPTPKED